jgi:hypothetical protein
MNSLDRVAVTARADADRALQQGLAIGEIEKSLTLAARAEKNKAVMEQAALSGIVPGIDSKTGDFVTGTAATGEGEAFKPGTGETLQGRQVSMTETEKANQRDMSMASLFGEWLGDGDPSSTATTEKVKTLEAQKFGLTKALAMAEQTGKIAIQTGLKDDGTPKMTMEETMSAKRFTWEKDVQKQQIELATQVAANNLRATDVQINISNNREETARFIATGQLREAVEARKDATFLASQKLEIERTKMKLDTLTSLANPATYLFAVRYGLLDQIGGALGIDFGDDAISSSELPQMVQPGSFPSMTDFQRATPTEREIMLAEVASSGGFTTDQAIRQIMEGAPGGADIRRTSLVGVSR